MKDWQYRSYFRGKRGWRVLAIVGLVMFVIYLTVVGSRGS
jgi:hypothetical protein